ncbi:TonB-dependent receptor domain-containing protein [Caulobacter segnis]
MPAQSLSVTLNRVARAGSVELAFDRGVTDRLRAPRLKGQFTVDQALTAALVASGLSVQRTRDGAYVVKPASPFPAIKPKDEGDGAVSEILVLGRRNLNTGIRRTRDDIQPYDVALDDTIRTAGASDIEAFLRRAMPANAQSASLVQAPVANAASARSRLDLLGLGSGQTLVLVDGRRLPSVPDAVGNGAGFAQADINGIPMAAVERIEVLTAAAGALHGAGATGGVVNIILKRDYQGAELGVSQGFTQHGGGLASRLDASIGRTSRDGRGGVSVRIGLAKDQGLDVGERSFGERALLANGADFAAGKIIAPYVPLGAAVNVTSSGGALTLKPAYGGGALGSAYTNFALSGFTAAEAVANAGKLNLELPADAFGETQSLTTRTLRRSLIVSARQEVGILEGFFDYLFLDNRGRALAPAGYAILSLSANSAYNPFEQSVYVSRSVPWDGLIRNRSASQRATAGLIARLPRGWMVEGDMSLSRSQVKVTNDARGAIINATLATRRDGFVGPGLSPFASQDEFLAAYRAYQVANGAFLKQGDTLADLNLRASGPLWRLPGGPLTMTVTAEAARERTSGGESFAFDAISQAPLTVRGAQLRLTTRSASAEWRAPLGAPDAPWLLRGLELQAAVRGDAYRMTAPQTYQNLGDGALAVTRPEVSEHTVLAKTLGLKTFAADGVMLRASYSEGHLPPRSDQVQSLILSVRSWPRTDPRRGGEILGAAGPLTIIQNGSPKLDPERAHTYSLGVVVEPRWLEGARLSVDYLRTAKRHEITTFAAGDVAYFLAREASYPTRIVRAPLTDADRANGYAAGAVTLIDTSALNSGRSVVETFDVSAEYRRAVGQGSVSGYLRGVWQPSYRRIANPEKSWIETAGYSDGPLRFRALAGGQWTNDALSLGLNAQYYGRYRVAASGFTAAPTNLAIAQPHGSRIASQVYLDAFAGWSIGGRTQVQAIVHNLLDATPPLALAAPTGYSTYGDARERSFQISLTQRF